MGIRPHDPRPYKLQSSQDFGRWMAIRVSQSARDQSQPRANPSEPVHASRTAATVMSNFQNLGVSELARKDP